jgi:hypothetical protein
MVDIGGSFADGNVSDPRRQRCPIPVRMLTGTRGGMTEVGQRFGAASCPMK